ncbi:Rpn family recombination-promoting nuclease/putative transposase [Nocardia huaxiensis]|uniref:Rpn family recombination-promoting nuclease/putative transposase n=1 Tax=Nocardia huaxiensis TaxID=2755382 RepID=A0A7D6V8L8_9NOCA|nr:Rpn family recombination-promoting nuclease/putative transposase [Nocardia huaxiensis]QLY28302.1 Rpn family recombination-promoting nuclease/putative transposase [Nocardia huaxiensis]UFS98259.1 Rpn family recombination-promoting nuclease/putative transposase [Nocardia huaxiensis]
MADSPSNPHDAYFRQVLFQPVNAVGELRAVLPEAVAVRVDWDGLDLQPGSYVPEELQSRFSDVLVKPAVLIWGLLSTNWVPRPRRSS